MLHHIKNRKKTHRKTGRECGASMFEAMVALCFMCFVFFALLQIYQWCTAKIFCRYSAYYGAKGKSLGYKTNLALRAARVAAIPVSGQSAGFRGYSELDDAQNYMASGDASGVWYRYWYPQRASEPEIDFWGNYEGDNVNATVTLKRAPLLSPAIGRWMGITENPEPAGSSSFYNYSKIYLED